MDTAEPDLERPLPGPLYSPGVLQALHDDEEAGVDVQHQGSAGGMALSQARPAGFVSFCVMLCYNRKRGRGWWSGGGDGQVSTFYLENMNKTIVQLT